MFKHEIAMNDLLQIEPVVSSEEVIIGPATSSDANFILANTEAITLEDLKNNCIVPSYAKDLESTISHFEFLESVMYATSNYFKRESILHPSIRVSHVVKGRIPEAVHKPVSMLNPEDQTQYFQRVAFSIEVPSIRENIQGNDLSLSIVAVRSYDLNSLSGKKREEQFKVGLGFVNRVCTNYCLFTDGVKLEIKARNVSEIIQEVYTLFSSFRPELQLETMTGFGDHFLTEHQFAQLVGRSRLYQYLPVKTRKEIPEIVPLTDSQISLVAKDYYNDRSFCREDNGEINLWRLFNLMTGSLKSSYIDSFLDRNVGVSTFVKGIQKALVEGTGHWFLS